MASLISKASLLMVPSVYEDGTLYNVLPSGNKAPDETGNHNGYDQTRADFTFSRGSNLSATRIGPNGLIEKGRENLLLQSNNFDTTWATNNASVTSGQSGYDGSSNAWKLQSSSTGVNYLYQIISSNAVQTFSIYAKAGNTDWMRINILQSGTNANNYYDISNGIKGVSPSAPIIDDKIESVGNGWYRISIVVNISITQIRIQTAVADGNETSASGDNIYIQDAQLEKGLVSTPVIRTGATTATAGVLENTPRIDYSSGAGALLLEPQRTNKFTHSEYIGSSDWLKSGNGSGSAPIVTTNYATSPEGVQNATRVQFDAVGTASTDRSTLAQRFAFTTGDVYTLSCWVKATSGSSTMFHMRINGAQVGGEKIATDEWQLFTETHTATATTTDDYGLQIRGSYSSNTSDILIYGMQLENASFGSSYVPTYGSAATRGADVCNSGGSAESINSTEGVLYTEMAALVNGGENRVMTISDGSYDNSVRIQLYTNTNEIEMRVVTGNAIQALQRVAITNTLNFNKVAVKYKANDFQLWVNGSKLRFDTSGTLPSANTFNTFNFDDGDGNSDFYGKVKQVAVFDEALSDAELVTLTT